ncbi:MAG: Imm8 family immunity protein [Cyanobacteria bacterium J06649_11]
MKAKLKRLQSPDIDLDSFSPEDLNDFGFLLEAYIVLDCGSGEESFGILVCTPKWLQRYYLDEMPLFSCHFMFVSRYDLEEIKEKIDSFCNQCK